LQTRGRSDFSSEFEYDHSKIRLKRMFQNLKVQNWKIKLYIDADFAGMIFAIK
jgi:hypothetical protein